MRRVFVHSLGESSARKKMFRDYLTFSADATIFKNIFAFKNIIEICTINNITKEKFEFSASPTAQKIPDLIIHIVTVVQHTDIHIIT